MKRWIRLKPACKHCNNQLTEDDYDWGEIAGELDENGEYESTPGNIDVFSLSEWVQGMELRCDKCVEKMLVESYEKELCYICYTEDEEVTGTIPTNFDYGDGQIKPILYCQDCNADYGV